MMLVNVKLDINGCNRIRFHNCRLYWYPFAMTQLKRIWPYWHSCIIEFVKISNGNLMQALLMAENQFASSVPYPLVKESTRSHQSYCYFL